MKLEFFNEAVGIIINHHTTELMINLPKPNGSIVGTAQEPTLIIKKCVPNVISKLVTAGFSLCATENGVEVYK